MSDIMMPRPVAILPDCRSLVVAVQCVTFKDLARWFPAPQIGEKDGEAWMPAEIECGRRTNERVKSISFLVLDVEGKAEPVNDDHGETLRDLHNDIIKRLTGAAAPDVDAMLAELTLQGWRCALHTSYSHKIENPRYRLIFDLTRPLTPAELKPLGLHVASRLGLSGCFDAACLDPARLFYLPRCPSEERKQLYRHAVLDGDSMPVDDLLSEMGRIDKAINTSREKRPLPKSTGVIDSFNAQNSISSILEKHGYVAKSGGRWLWPESTTGAPGVRLLPEDGRGERAYSSHGGDPLNDTHAHDAFDCMRILEHGGDTSAAVKDAADRLGLASASAPPRGEQQPGGADAPAGDDAWPEPQALTVKMKPQPYPINALPVPIRQAVEEVAGFVKAPIPLVAGAALAALSLAIQAHADVQRAEKLHGPSGLFLLTIADSGERKSTCDGFFTKPIHDFEAAQSEAAKPKVQTFNANIGAWEAKCDGVKKQISQLAKESKPTANMEAALLALSREKPEAPRIPRLLYADVTPEALAYALAKQWPSAGVVTAEAGIVFGSHGMGKESVMRNLGLLNQLWDGTSLTIDRRTSEALTVRGARLTMALQVQEPTLREFFARSGTLARGTGFFARFLLAWPGSTQGLRPFTEAPANWPALEIFKRRLTAILDQPVTIDEDGALIPPMLSLTPEAKAAWVKYHDTIESELASGGELYDVRDVASKSADNAARLAALFQVFEGAGGAIGVEAFDGASQITAWHLTEARRFFGELALPVELADAARLDSWLIEHCNRAGAHSIGKNYVRQHGPLRDGARLDKAFSELAEFDRLRLVKNGKRQTIQINPALL